MKKVNKNNPALQSVFGGQTVPSPAHCERSAQIICIGNRCKLLVISKFSPFFFINKDFVSLTNPSPQPCILSLLRRIKNPIPFNILTRSNYMFND